MVKWPTENKKNHFSGTGIRVHRKPGFKPKLLCKYLSKSIGQNGPCKDPGPYEDQFWA